MRLRDVFGYNPETTSGKESLILLWQITIVILIMLAMTLLPAIAIGWQFGPMLLFTLFGFSCKVTFGTRKVTVSIKDGIRHEIAITVGALTLAGIAYTAIVPWWPVHWSLGDGRLWLASPWLSTSLSQHWMLARFGAVAIWIATFVPPIAWLRRAFTEMQWPNYAESVRAKAGNGQRVPLDYPQHTTVQPDSSTPMDGAADTIWS